jgi:K+-sensing histidine kinase KdpD
LIKNNETIGLGLYVSKNIINGLGGQIDFTSLHKEGTTFILSINAEKENKYPRMVKDSTN